jgi:two-component system, chemotaxis family, CheB/CheR fusion protein
MAVGKDHFVVAIGASAGGLEAIHEFFDHMSDSANLSFVIIQHLSSDYKSLLVELVSRHTRMKVFEAANDTPIERNCIYVIPNNKLITIQKNRLCLEEKKNNQAPNNAIDTFLYSLSKHKTNRAIAVILSGTGTDGTRGIEAIKNNGGMVIVQDPSTAKFNGMPNSAIQLGIIDHILPPAAMPEEIINYIREPQLMRDDVFSEEMLEEIFTLIHQAVGFDFHYYKLPTLKRRIIRRMVQLGLKKSEEYLTLLRSNKDECKQLGNDFLIGVTRFFRDNEAFKELGEKVIAPLVAQKNEHDTIKVWVCACSTGEEAYSIGILLNEQLEKSGKNVEVKIFATDIDEVSIEIASKGIYPKVIENDLEKRVLEKYFTPKNGGYQISQKIRKQIVFARHDVIRDPPFINNDIVSCRNMLIYISPHLQQKIFSLLLFALNRNGYLFLGSSEHSSFIRENVDEINGKWKLYKKIRDSKIASHYLTHIAEKASYKDYRKSSGSAVSDRSRTIWDALKDAFADDINIAAFFIDQAFNIKETAGNFEKFLSLPKKTLQLNLLGMMPAELYFVMSTEIKKAWKKKDSITLKNLKSKKDGKFFFWQAVIKPLQPYTLVIITEQAVMESVNAEQLTHDDSGKSKDNYIITLENELEEVRNNLDLAVEDLETTNEELQSSNEELLSANEELQSSNEELQSLNEELHTLNTEHQLKIKELVELNDDLNNYFRSTDIAQIFLDKDLNIRKYNPSSASMINFIESDIGRPLSHISNNIQYTNLLNDVQQVMRDRQIIEKEVMLANNKNLLMRIMPYLNRDKEINGVVITFVDITTITQLNYTIRAVLNSSPGYILAFKAVRTGRNIDDFVLQTINNAASNFIGRSVHESAGMSLKKDISYLATPLLFEQYVKVVESDASFHKDVFLEHDQKWYSLIAVKMMDGFVATVSDITSKKRSEQKLKKNYLELISTKDSLKKANEALEFKVKERTRALAASEERFRLVASATNDALWDWDLVNDSVWWGETFFKIFGYDKSNEHTKREYWLEKLHPDDFKYVRSSLYEAINNGSKEWRLEYRFRKKNNQYAHILDRAYILHDEFGTPYRMLGSMFDVTDLKNAEHKLSTMNEQLEHKVIERTQELEHINNALEQSNSDLQQFASVASHDLQEPLRKIQMFSKAIKDAIEENGNGNTDDTSHYVDKIIHSSDRMRSLITDVLNYSRLSDNNSTFAVTDLNEIIKGTLEDFELTIKEKNATIQVGELPVLPVIPGQIRQVFQNLISNALKFSKKNVPPLIRITSQPLAKRSFMSMVQKDGPFYSITISDNGIGFDPQFSNNIFNLFQRLHSKDKFEGTGIGLAITKKIVEKHNGLIRADSKEDVGATFVIILPSKPTL